MIKNNMIIAFRFLAKKPLFTILNILGLAIGIAASVFIFHYINYEKSYDTFYQNDNIYRLTYGRLKDNGDDVEFASACPVIAPLLKDNFPEILKIGRMAVREVTFSYKENKFTEKRAFYAEKEIIDILSLNLIHGSFKNALNNPNQIVINKTIALKYFGKENPIGKKLKLNRKEEYTVVAVFKDFPPNAHIHPELLLSFPNLQNWRGKEYLESWGHTGAFTYLVLKPGTDPRELEKRFIDYTKELLGDILIQYKLLVYFNLQPIESIHLNSHLLQEHEANGDKSSVNFMYIIGAFILIIAWVNYINLTTSRSLERAKEVGVRKVSGAYRKNLMAQFYTESAIVNFLSLFVSVILIIILRTGFCRISGIPVNYNFWDKQWHYVFLIITFLFGTFITGMYPVFAISSFKVITILKGKFSSNKRMIHFRKLMVVFQLAISILLIAGTYSVFNQLQYLKNQNLGFDMDQTLVVKIPKAIDSTFVQKKETFKQEVSKLSSVNGVAFSTEVPGRKIWWDNGGIFKVGLDPSDGKNYMIMGVDDKFIDLYHMKIIAGRNFSRDFPSDKDAVILNETAVKWLEFKNVEDALNNKINYWGKIYTVIGILKDYKHESPKALPEPEIFRYLPNESRFGNFSIKLNNNHKYQSIDQIENIWNKLFEGNPFDYFFLDIYYNEQFDADKKFGEVFGVFSTLAIFITSLGLFGLSLYTVQLKTKEIGIRKVHGASFIDITKYILKEYVLLVFIAIIISIPIFSWGVIYWLNNFPVKMPIKLLLYIIPIFIVALITMISVAAHTIKAANLNPIDSIKYE